MHHWYLFIGSLKLFERILNANLLQSCGAKRIAYKQYFKSKIILWLPFCISIGEGNPGCSAPIRCMVPLTSLRSWINLHFPYFFFQLQKRGEFQGGMEGIMWPLTIYSCNNCYAACNSSSLRGHWLTHTRLSLFQIIGSARSKDFLVTTPKNTPILPWEPFY